MTRERIIMENEIITDDYIYIGVSHTCFCRKERIYYPDINELEKRVKSLRKELRDLGVKLYRTDTLKILREMKDDYNEMVDEYNDTFDLLVDSWKKKMETGMFVGYSDDNEYWEVLTPLEWKLEKMNYRSTLLSQIRYIEKRVDEVEKDIQNGVIFISVGI